MRNAGYRYWLGIWLLCASLAACAAQGGTLSADPVSGGNSNPLVGRIWQPGTQTWMTRADLHAALIDSRFILLGAKHDNPIHHRLQARLLAAVIAGGRRPAIAFEMLDTTQEPALRRFLAQPDPNAQALGAAVQWKESGWPPWSQYAPIAREALTHDLPIIAANLPVETVRAVAGKGFDALESPLVHRLHLYQPWPASLRKRLLHVLDAAHCHLLSAATLSGMANAQRLRDAFMAYRLHASATDGGAILIAGAGHVRTDFGVPLHLRRYRPASDIFALALVPVSPKLQRPQAYAARFGARQLPYDAVLFTAATSQGNSCTALRRHFGDTSSAF